MKPTWKTWLIITVAILGILFVLDARVNATASSANQGELTLTIDAPVSPVLSVAVRDIAPSKEPALSRETNPIRWLGEGVGESGTSIGLDPLAAHSVNGGISPDPLVTFEGVPSISGVTPPDTNGDVGPNHYVQMTNFSFQIWDKGDPNNAIPPTPLTSPITTGALFGALGGQCTNDFGDPVVLYDDMADRWLLSQFGLNGPLAMCIAISTTPDPTGTYFLYEIPIGSDFPDYPKLGVWPDAYYMGTNTGFPNAYVAHAFDRQAMLAGQPAGHVGFGGLANFMMPADVDGQVPPPAGSPGIFYTFYHPDGQGHPAGVPRLAFYEFDVDWNTPGNSTYTLVEELPVANFNYTGCGFFAGGCVPQPGTGQLLDDLSWWPMHRLQYRNFGGYEAMVGTYTVDPDGTNRDAPRWFEVRKAGSTYSLYQEGTYDPSNDSRWMSSIAMDISGNIALGYSVSSSSVIPSIRYATRLAGDPLGTLNAEAEMWTGGGVQTGIHRWGDYSAMTVDPVDGCTFWYTTEYHDVTDSGFGWNTRIGVFRIPTCGGPHGWLTGQVTDADTSLGVPGANVYATASITKTGSATTDANGFYTMTLLVGTYNVTATAYAYLPDSIGGVGIISGTTSTENFSLTPAESVVVEGVVTDDLMDWPLYARIDIGNGYPGGPVWTDPVSGYYSVTLPVGVYPFDVQAFVEGYTPQTTVVTVTSVLAPESSEAITTSYCSSPTLAMPDNNPAGVNNAMVIADTGSLTDVNVSLNTTHTFAGDLRFTVTHNDTATTITPFDRPGYTGTGFGCGGNNFDIVLDDDGEAAPGTPVETSCTNTTPAYTTGGYYTPNNPLSGFDGQALNGTWTINASDNAGGDTGTLNTWCVIATTTGGGGGAQTENLSLPADPVACTAPGYQFGTSGAYFNDFEANDGGFTVSGTPSWAWGTPTSGPGSAHSGVNVWATNLNGNYNDFEDTTITSPNIDLSAFAGDPILVDWWQWLQTEQGFDYASVDVSNNGGSSWTTIYGPIDGSVDLSWTEHTVLLDSSYAVSNFQVRFHFTSDVSVTFPGWYIDDLSVYSGSCDPQTGGLVVGNVYDVNTSLPVNGAWVTNETPGEVGYAMETPDDPAVDDAFYTIFSFGGSQVHTATYDLYGEDVQTVSVVDFDTVGQDFYLPSGFIITDPDLFDITLELGTNATLPLTLTDIGGANVEFVIGEQGGTNPFVFNENPSGTMTELYKAEKGIEVIANTASGTAIAYPSAYRWDPTVPSGTSILVYADDPYHTPTHVEDALQALGLGYTLHNNADFTGFESDLTSGTWDIVIFADDNFQPTASTFTAMNNYAVGGGKLIVHTWSIGVDPGNALWTTLGISSYVDDFDPPDPVYWWEPSHSVFTNPNDVPEFTALDGFLFGTYGQNLEPLPGFDAIAGFTTPGPDPNQTALILGNDGNTVFRGFLDGQNSADLDSDFIADGTELWINLIDGISSGFGGGDVPWVSETPITGTVPANSDFFVDVTFDAAQVPVPGQYTAFLNIGVDTPQLEVVIPLTLTVTCSTCGTVQGAITDEATTLPLTSTIHITNTGSFDFLLEDVTSYNVQLLPGQYYINASASGYLSETAVVNITTGNTTTQDFALWANTSILSFSPPSVEEFMAIGDVVSNTITVTNTGAAPMEFEVNIGGYSGPLALVPVSTRPISIPRSDGNFPRGEAAPSYLPAPKSDQATSDSGLTQPLILGGGAQAYGAEFFSLEFVGLTTDNPGTLTNIGPLGATQFFAGDFINGDFSTLYTLDYGFNALYTVDVATGVFTQIGPSLPAGGQVWTGMAGDPTTGDMYATSTDCNANTLYTVDLGTGAVTSIGSASGYCVIGIAVSASGEMYGLDILADNLLSIDKSTGAVTIIGSVGFDANFAQGMDFDEAADILYLAAYNNGGATGELRIADVTTGNTTLVGLIGSGATELDAFGIATGGGGAGGWAYAVPDFGTVPAFSSTTFELVFDAQSLYQVGDYYATLSFNGSFANDPATMPLTMHVTCPTCGFMAGDIYDSFTTAPVNADVVVTSGNAVTITFSGVPSYTLAVQPGTYDFLVTADGYFSQTASVTVAAGETIITDFPLVPIVAILESSPASYEHTVALNTVLTDSLTIGNIGTVAFDYELSDVQTGASNPLVALADRPTPTYSEPAAIGPLSVRSAESQVAFGSSVTPLSWGNGAPLPGGQAQLRYAHAQCVDTPNSIYVISGVDGFFSITSNAWRYDADTDSWTALASFPAPQEGPSAVCFDGFIYVAGGGGTNQFYIYDIANDSWTAGPALPRLMWGAAMGASNDMVYMIGGDSDFFSGGTSAEVNIYDIGSGTWVSNGTSMPTATSTPGFTQIGNYVYVVGGWGDSAPSSNIDQTQRYDMSSDTWETGPTFTSGQSDFALAATDTYLYAMGGDANGGGYFDMSNQVNILDYGAWPGGSWADLGDPLPQAFTANNGGFCTDALSGGEVSTFGGVDSGFTGVGSLTYRTSESCAVGVSDALWLLELPAFGTVDANEADDVNIIFDSTVVTQTGTYTAEMRIRGTFDNSVEPIIVVMHVVTEALPAVTVDPDQSSVQTPGTTVTYTVDVTNDGNVTDIFSLEAVSSLGWAVSLSDASVLLNPGESASVTVVVQVPVGAADGDVDVTTVTATSSYDGSVSDSADLTTTVSVPVTIFNLFLPIVKK